MGLFRFRTWALGCLAVLVVCPPRVSCGTVSQALFGGTELLGRPGVYQDWAGALWSYFSGPAHGHAAILLAWSYISCLEAQRLLPLEGG